MAVDCDIGCSNDRIDHYAGKLIIPGPFDYISGALPFNSIVKRVIS